MVSGVVGGAIHDWRGRRADQAQRHLDVHVHRVDAQRREPDVRRLLEFFSRRVRPAVCLYRDDGRGR